MSWDDGDNFDDAVIELLGDVAPVVSSPNPSTQPAVSSPQPGVDPSQWYGSNPYDNQFSGPLDEPVVTLKDLHQGEAVLDDTRVMPQIESALSQHTPYRDPLIAQLERFAKAGQTAGGKSDEFYQYVEARRAEAQANNNLAEQVGNPASIVGKRLGGSVTVFPSATKGQSSVLSWQAEDDSETGPVTVTIGLATPLAVQGTPTSALRPYAYVVWGSYGFSANAELDVGRGLQFVVNASSMSISLGLDADAADSTDSANLFAYISFRPCVRTAQLMRSKYIDSLVTGAGGAQTIAVPNFANYLLPVQMSDTAGQVQLDFIDTKNVIRYSLQISNGSQGSEIPITSDIVSVKVTGLSAATQHVRLPFELSM